MKFYAEIDGQKRIKPLYNSDYDKVQKLKRKTAYRFDVVRERNYLFHKKVMALYNIGFENQEQYLNFDHYRKVVTMKAGYYETITTDKGEIYLPLSISFSSMDQNEFEALFTRLLDVISEQLDSQPFEIRKQIDDFL